MLVADYILTVASESSTLQREVRCSCSALLFINNGYIESVQIKCRKCKRINTVQCHYK